MNSNVQNVVNMGFRAVQWSFPFGEQTASLLIPGWKPNQEEMQSLIDVLNAFKNTLPKQKEEDK